VKSVRQQLLDRFPPPPRAIQPDQQLGHALYFMLGAIGDPDVSVDGWKVFKVTGESDVSLDVVGLMWLLPAGSMPVALRVDVTDAGLSWRAQASLKDEGWLSLPDSKRWKNVYLFAGGDRPEPPWSWDRTYTGFLPRADA
jgi:hypothetical protein